MTTSARTPWPRPARRVLAERGRACHALAVPVPGTLRAHDVRERLDEASRRWPGLGRVRLWETGVPGPRGGASALARTHREALRPLHGEPFALRAVLLRHSDATGTLVLVARRDRVPHRALDRLADLLLGVTDTLTPVPAAPVSEASQPARPDWGLGDPAREGVVGAVPVALPRPVPRRALLGAAALALARYSGAHAVAFALVGTADETGLVRVDDIDEEHSAAGYLSRIEVVPGADAAVSLGVVLSPPAGAGGRVRFPFQSPPFPLTLHVAEGEEGEASLWFDEGAVARPVAADFGASVARLAERLAAGTAGPLAAIPVLGPDETERVLRAGGAGTPPPEPVDDRIDRRFDDVARRSPDAVAVVDGAGELTYRRLGERATEVAAGLRALGAGRGDRVGVCLDRDAAQVVALLGVLKAGCAYVPMDLRNPPDRLRWIAEDAGTSLVIADPGGFPETAGVRTVPLDGLEAAASEAAASEPAPSAAPDDPAYVIYTSGSTGRPKGVVVPHRNVLALLAATAPGFGLGADDVWTLFHSSAFDFSVWEMWGCLLTGGRLVVVPYWTARDGDAFRELLAARRVTVLSQTPSAFAQLVRADARAGDDLDVRLLVFGGEPLDVRLLAPWFRRYSPARCRAVNMFGITETTVHVTAQTVGPAEVAAGSRSVGRALPGWSVSVRDARGRVLPPGAAGEIWVGGAGVAAGYLGRPELTAGRFVRDAATGARLYRSGDRGRLRPDGRLDHLGRLDGQLKIRGHRVEPDEIRSVLAADPEVSAAVVVLRRLGAGAGDTGAGDASGERLDGYVVLTGDDPARRAAAARRILAGARRVLPDYMAPDTLTAIPEIPLTANGKPDLGRLPEPAALAPERAGPPPGPEPGGIAADVLGIWSRCLRADVTPQDNFFELGGNSLLVLRVLSEMAEKGLPRITARDFYTHSGADRFIGLVEALAAAPHLTPETSGRTIEVR
ncbi:non-ribosomal peptide synthetase [Actinomadura sp. NAK00032]|uniref:non-ribosomal peptide synthetase n=1 Tax=Actinomadura sp. NAK00032 TaxID=2742128 RepID=UPI001591A851|nr:non-ribosomal peptide synthetase [Actinomadura sp. NAK00032]QKW35626.1 non-ribosomal peptide synthetase [Actinomadura sp. NAK00032]